MQVVILCGGTCPHFAGVAGDIPKPMAPVGGKPMVWHVMRCFAQFGFTEFILCLPEQSWVIKRFFLDYHFARSDFALTLGDPGNVRVFGGAPEEKWQVILAETGLDSLAACRLKRVEKYLTGEQFFLTYGDSVGDVNLRELLEFHRGHGKIGTMTAVRPPSHLNEITLSEIQVAEFNEKPLITRGRISGGFFVFDRRIFESLHDDPHLDLERGPITQLARQGELRAYLHNSFWQSLDSTRDYEYLNELCRQNLAPWNTRAVAQVRTAA
jgi:glucose-1-phosphate cytidylyltransferase